MFYLVLRIDETVNKDIFSGLFNEKTRTKLPTEIDGRRLDAKHLLRQNDQYKHDYYVFGYTDKDLHWLETFLEMEDRIPGLKIMNPLQFLQTNQLEKQERILQESQRTEIAFDEITMKFSCEKLFKKSYEKMKRRRQEKILELFTGEYGIGRQFQLKKEQKKNEVPQRIQTEIQQQQQSYIEGEEQEQEQEQEQGQEQRRERQIEKEEKSFKRPKKKTESLATRKNNNNNNNNNVIANHSVENPWNLRELNEEQFRKLWQEINRMKHEQEQQQQKQEQKKIEKQDSDLKKTQEVSLKKIGTQSVNGKRNYPKMTQKNTNSDISSEENNESDDETHVENPPRHLQQENHTSTNGNEKSHKLNKKLKLDDEYFQANQKIYNAYHQQMNSQEMMKEKEMKILEHVQLLGQQKNPNLKNKADKYHSEQIKIRDNYLKDQEIFDKAKEELMNIEKETKKNEDQKRIDQNLRKVAAGVTICGAVSSNFPID